MARCEGWLGLLRVEPSVDCVSSLSLSLSVCVGGVGGGWWSAAVLPEGSRTL